VTITLGLPRVGLLKGLYSGAMTVSPGVPLPSDNGIGHLRVLIANERRDRLELLAQVVSGLGHEVIAREVEVREVAAVTAREQPDVALVGLGLSSEHALDLIGEIVHEASCPVIALLTVRDPAYVREAAKRGVFAYIVDTTPEELQSAIDITLQRFAEYHSLQGAFGRRAVIEQAKGILMARHGLTGDRAFEMLREHSQHGGRKLADIAASVVESHLLLAPLVQDSPSSTTSIGGTSAVALDPTV
jgi:AmiR/NasT family two-component response regulator